METINNTQQKPVLPPSNNKSSTTVGTIIILFGIFLLMKNLDLGYFFPNWLFGWEMILIIIGLVIGVNSKFQKKSSIILIAIGSIFLLKDLLNFSTGKVLIPILAISIGIYIINRNRKTVELPTPPQDPPKHPTDEFDWDKRVIDFSSDTNEQAYKNTIAQEPTAQGQYSNYYAENYLKVESIFGNAKKIVLSKNFLGGTITNVFGSTQVNLLQADLRQPIVIDVFSLFGSTKIIVPPHWMVNSSISSILSETDDRRVIINHAFDDSKKLYITGTSIFGNVTIKNS
ncbi:LiaF transmembrane domain-containing protein [Sphingobacterium rhinopitheci]|uniref:LiaF transmembrane domain-containing protein n=1 Tax=Sphingobacterium rhinopitheci TaxID=2781960 RepID=UPI001F51A1B2|nr:DUF5668 domain-containing protein [Sphingobacterium rhinopitheci]MCI0919909.1 hypothetical protein [Sphingobacterium rhinopitheci]